MNIPLAERQLKTKFGIFREILFYDGQKESIALVMGNVENGEDVLCRVHSRCISASEFNSIECDCREQMEISQFLIEQNGSGVVIWLDQEGKGNGHLALIGSGKFKEKGYSQADAYVSAGYLEDGRNYKQAAKILKDLGVKSIILLANKPSKAKALRKENIVVSGTKELKLKNDDETKIFEKKIRKHY
jgi:GTP cyclohydrolase II